MEALRIEHKTSSVIRKSIAVILIINGLFWILGHLDSLKFYHWLFGVVFIIAGTAHFTNGFGSEKSYILEGKDSLKIKWMNWFRSYTIPESEIGKITLTRFRVIIERKEKKPLKLNIDFFERDQKKEVYDYFIEYSRNKNLELIRDF
jgi:hypothetical protein